MNLGSDGSVCVEEAISLSCVWWEVAVVPCLVFGEKWQWYQQNHQVTMWSSSLHSMTLCQSLRTLTLVSASEWRFCVHTWMTVFKQWFCSNLFYIAVCMYTVQFNSLYTISLLIQTKIQGTMYLLTRSKHKRPHTQKQQQQHPKTTTTTTTTLFQIV